MCKKGESGESQKMGGTVEGIESMRRRIQKVSRARTFKCLWGPGIDSKE